MISEASKRDNGRRGWRKNEDAPPAPIADREDTLIVSVRLASGRFDSSIQIPLFSSKEQREAFVESWLALIAAGLKCGERP